MKYFNTKYEGQTYKQSKIINISSVLNSLYRITVFRNYYTTKVQIC